MKSYFSVSASWLLLALLTRTGFSEGQTEHYVHPNNQEHSCPQNSSCFDLAHFVDSITTRDIEIYNEFTNDVVINFLEGVYFFNETEPILIARAQNLTLQGIGTTGQVGFHETVKQSSVQMVCQPSATTGFVFYSSEHISIKGITFIGCGASLNRSISNDSVVIAHAALAFLSVTNLTLDHVSVLNGTEYGLLAVNALDVMISDSSFSGSNWRRQCSELADLTDCYGGNAMFYFRRHRKCCSHPYFINIRSSNFSFGLNSQDMSGGLGFSMLPGPSVGIDVMLNSVVAYGNIGKTGANLLYITSTLVTAHSLTILNSNISNGNKYMSNVINPVASSGGGLYFAPGLVVNVNGSYTECNSILSENLFSSGDLHLMDGGSGDSNGDDSVQSETLLHIENTTILANSAVYGGGMFVSILSPAGILQKVNIINSTITDNTGLAGSGLYLEEFDYLDLDTTLEININNLTISHNHPHPIFEVANDACAFYISSVDNLHLSGLVVSTHVTTGIILHNSFVVLSGNSNSIHDNSGKYGGGLALFGSYLFCTSK